jgi:hypothetical protein
MPEACILSVWCAMRFFSANKSIDCTTCGLLGPEGTTGVGMLGPESVSVSGTVVVGFGGATK